MPKKQKLLLVMHGNYLRYREDLITLCGDTMEAQILDLFDLWTRVRFEKIKKVEEYNKKNPDNQQRVPSLWLYENCKVITKALFLPPEKVRTVQRTMKSLIGKDFIESREDGGKLSRTKLYRLNIKTINNELAKIGESLQNAQPERHDDVSDLQNAQPQRQNDVSARQNDVSSIYKNNQSKKEERETSEEADRSLSFFSESEPESEQLTEPTENLPLLVKTEIKSEDKPTPNLQGQEKNQGVSVENENKAPQPPAYYIPSSEQNEKSIVKFPPPGDINNAAYCQQITKIRLILPEEIAIGAKDIFKWKYGRHLLCLLNDQGIDPIANLAKFLRFYFDKNLANNANYKGLPYDDSLQTKSANAIASKIKIVEETGIVLQTIADFKKKITKPVETAPQINFCDPIPEGDRYTLPKIDNLFEAQKKRIKQQQAGNKPKMTSLPQNEVSTILESVTASNANLTPNPETFDKDNYPKLD